jgi:hypothetical protein
MRKLIIAALAAAAQVAAAQECTTTTTTTTTCRGAAAPLAAPPVEEQPVAQPTYPQPTYPQPTPQYAPPPAYYVPPLLPPVSTHTELRPRYGLLISGLVIFGADYMLNASIAYISGEGRLAVPVIGPILAGSDVTSHGCTWDCAGDRMLMALVVFDSLIQATGLILFIAGAVTKTKVTVYDKVAILPSAAPGGVGLAAVGHF